MLEFIQGEVAVDPYVDHQDLEAILKLRLSQGWTLVQTIECAPAVTAPARDMLTLIWNKMEPKAVTSTANTQYATFAEPMVVR